MAQEPDKIDRTVDKNQKIDIEFLSQAMEAFNAATVKLQSSYNLLQEEARKLRQEIEDKNKKLSDVSNLLESILNNTRSSILVSSSGDIIIKNRAGEKLIESIGENKVKNILSFYREEGVFDHMDSDTSGGELYFRISVGYLEINDIKGAVYVLDDITNIKRMEKERNRSEKLQIMGEMVANIAHDIRNPLGSMELFAALLERDLHEPDKKRLTANILKSIRIINGIISNTLLFSKEIHVKKQQYFLADIVDDVVLYLQHTLKEKKASVINKLEEDHGIWCDKDLFRQVVMNVVHNAVDAVTSQDGVIVIESEQGGDFIKLSVQDNGCGISDEMKPHLFMPFQTTKAKGTGLGLSIAYKIVKAHNGDIVVISDGKSYSRFEIILPQEQ